MQDINLSKRQLDIVKILREQTFSEKNLSNMYLGAIMVKEDNKNPEAIYQAAHSLRELTYYMTYHLSRKGIKKHREQMKVFISEFDYLGGVTQEAIIKQWYDLHNYFVNLCHHHDNMANPIYFEEKFSQLENIILSIHGPIYDSINELEKLLEIENPTLEDLEMALSLIKNLSTYEYFFSNLKFPNWLELLDEKGLYNSTPKFGERSIEPLFLLRIVKEKSDKVLDIIKRHSNTDHPGARINFIKCLTQMSHSQISQMIKPIKKWINSQRKYTPSLYYPLTELILKILEDNGVGELFDLLKSMYAIKEEILENDQKLNEILEKRWEEINLENYEMNNIYQEQLPGEFQEENQSYLYDDLIRKVLSNLMQKYPIKTLNLFSTILRISIKLFFKDKNQNLPDDLSLIWRKFLEKKPVGENFRNVLVSVIRDIILYCGNNKQEKFSEVIKELRKFDYLIFRRLEFLLYYNFPELSTTFIRNLEVDQNLFKNIDENYELFHFLETSFDKLSKTTQENYRKFIIKGAKKERKEWKKRKWKKLRWKKVYPELTEAEIYQFEIEWQKRKIKAIKNYINQDFIDDLHIKMEEIDKITLFKEPEIIFGPKIPISKERFEEMNIDSIISYLLTYDDKSKIGFSKIGLGRELESIVHKRSNEFIKMLANALENSKLHKYISYIIRGLSTALNKEKKINLEEIFSIFEKILSNEIKIDKEPIFLKEDTNWDINKSIANFIHDNLKLDKISIKYKDNIWNLIVKLIKQGDLSKEIENENIQRNWMPREMHLNSIHGVTIESIFSFISWVIESEPNEFKDEDNKLTIFFPKVLEMFEYLKNDSLYTTRYIFGRNLNYLVHLEKDWVRKNIDLLFPRDDERIDYFEATWAGLLSGNRIYAQTFDILRPFYLFSLNKINENEKLIAFSKKLFVNQIAVLYIDGIESLENENSLISIFLDTADDIYREILFRDIGVNLDKYQKEENNEEIKIRLQSLLEKRLEKIKLGKVKEFLRELNGFIYWFRNSIFDKSWMINKFIEILKLFGNNLGESWFIIDNLMNYVDSYPKEVITIMEIITKNDIKDGFLVFEDKYKNILKILIISELEEVKQRTVDLTNYLLKMNFHNFKDLLTEN